MYEAPAGERGGGIKGPEDWVLVGLKSPLGASPHRASCSSFQGPSRWAGAMGGAAPHFVPSSSLCLQHPPFSLNVDLASPPSTALGPIQEAAARTLRLPGPCWAPACGPFTASFLWLPCHPRTISSETASNPPSPDLILRVPHCQKWVNPGYGAPGRGSFRAFSTLLTRTLH